MSNATLEQVIEQARSLPIDERRKLRDALDYDLRAAPPYRTREPEREWIERHRDEYMNQWVALDGDRLLAHGTDARAVADAARAAGCDTPFVEHVKPPLEAFWGGWT